jgi:hypothetical protein
MIWLAFSSFSAFSAARSALAFFRRASIFAGSGF